MIYKVKIKHIIITSKGKKSKQNEQNVLTESKAYVNIILTGKRLHEFARQLLKNYL